MSWSNSSEYTEDSTSSHSAHTSFVYWVQVTVYHLPKYRPGACPYSPREQNNQHINTCYGIHATLFPPNIRKMINI